jgi:hypothetical protein
MEIGCSSANLLLLIRAEYLEIPGLHLTQRQVEHLWGIDSTTADAVLRALVEARFLMKTGDAYVRAGASGIAPSSRGFDQIPGRRPGVH